MQGIAAQRAVSADVDMAPDDLREPGHRPVEDHALFASGLIPYSQGSEDQVLDRDADGVSQCLPRRVRSNGVAFLKVLRELLPEEKDAGRVLRRCVVAVFFGTSLIRLVLLFLLQLFYFPCPKFLKLFNTKFEICDTSFRIISGMFHK